MSSDRLHSTNVTPSSSSSAPLLDFLDGAKLIGRKEDKDGALMNGVFDGSIKLSAQNINQFSRVCIASGATKLLIEAIKRYNFTEIDLSGLHIEGKAANKPNGVSALVEVLEAGLLTKLVLNNTIPKIGNDGAIKLAKASANNKALTHLSLDENDIGNGTVSAIATMIKNSSLVALSLRKNKFCQDDERTILTANSRPKELAIHFFPSPEKYQLDAKSLREKYKFDEKPCAAVQAYFGHGTIPLEHNPDLTQHSKHGHKILPTQAGMGIVQVAIENEDIEALSCLLDKCHVCAIEFNTEFSDFDIRQMPEHNANKLATCLKENPPITELGLGTVDKGIVKIIATALQENNVLTTLKIGQNSGFYESLNIDDWNAIAELLEKSSTLTKLDLSRVTINPDGVQEIVNRLKSNSTLQELTLSDGRRLSDLRSVSTN